MKHMASEEDSDGEWLSLGDDRDVVRLADELEITLEAMADMLDQTAENCNAHDFCGSHQALAKLLFKEIGREAATRVFRRLCNYGGLHGGCEGIGQQVAVEVTGRPTPRRDAVNREDPDFYTVITWGVRYDGGFPITWGQFHGIKCPKCGHKFKPVFSDATTCPECGYTRPEPPRQGD